MLGPVSTHASALVLVVDDVPENVALARATLEDEGFRVVSAKDGQEAIAAVSRERPDCVLMDIRMPGVDGIAAAEQIRRLPEGMDTAIIFVTAQRDVATFDRALAAGGDDFITKPYRPDELIMRVQTAMRLHRLAAERSDLVEQLKLQRDQLKRMELQKEALVAFVVHDLKNPVSSIELNTQRLLRKPNDEAVVKVSASRIQDETRAMLRLIMNLLDISKADERALAPARQSIDAKQLVDGVIEELQLRAANANVTFAPRINAASVTADRDLLHRVLANLVDNAIRHAPEHSEIRITVEPYGDSVELSVADAGSGIPVAQRDSAFDRFVSSGTSTNRGLGLAFCKVAVEAHGGTIWIEDAAPGAVFRLRLPS
jgi:two-component system, sensor histidine kinase and response regulator